MAHETLGRTNRAFPSVWLGLAVPEDGTEIPGLVAAARATGRPIDLGGNPALWGGHLRGDDAAFLTTRSTTGYETATDARHATDLIQAHLIETLSAIGREWIDVYFLTVRRAVEESVLTGVLEAMELARQEGHIRFSGILCDGPAFATLGTWQFNDAFELLLVPRNHYDDEPYRTLAPLARERRVGIVTYRPYDWAYGLPFDEAVGASPDLRDAALADLAQAHPVIAPVRSAAEVARAERAEAAPVDPAVVAQIERLRSTFDDDATWRDLRDAPNPRARAAFGRRERDLA